jgi:hypothetical protein
VLELDEYFGRSKQSGLALMIVSSLFPGGVMQLYVDSCSIIGHGSNDLNLHALDLIDHSCGKS